MLLIQFHSHWHIRKEAKFGQKGLGLRVIGGSLPRSTWDTRLGVGVKPAVWGVTGATTFSFSPLPSPFPVFWISDQKQSFLWTRETQPSKGPGSVLHGAKLMHLPEHQ